MADLHSFQVAAITKRLGEHLESYDKLLKAVKLLTEAVREMHETQMLMQKKIGEHSVQIQELEDIE